MAGPKPYIPKPPGSASGDIILQDHILTDGFQTSIEVRSGSIVLRREGQADQDVALSGGQAALDGISEDIRCQIARKIAVLVPTLGELQKAELFAYSLSVLKILARDQAVRVRRMVAEELKALPNAPQEVIHQLLWDDQKDIVLPILEFSPLLMDDELLEIIADSPVPGVAEAIARRNKLSENVVDAIAEGTDSRAIETLLKNTAAPIRESTMLELVEKAQMHEQWYESILMRPNLTLRTVNHIGKFASASLLRELQEKKLLDPESSLLLSNALKGRLKSVKVDEVRSADIRANDMLSKGKLTAEAVSEALDRNDTEFFISALALLSHIDKEIIQRILKSQNAKAITALAWKAGLSMRTAIQMQMRIARVPPGEMLNAKGGTDFPLSERMMQDYLQHFTG